jgi:hypothetical protein
VADKGAILEGVRRGLITPEQARGMFSGQPSIAEPVKPQVGAGEDMVRGFASGVARGVPDLANVVAAGLNTGVEYLGGGKRTFTDFYKAGDKLDDKLLGEEYQPVTKAGEYAKLGGSAVITAPLVGVGGTLTGTAGQVAKNVAGAAVKNAAGGFAAGAGGDIGAQVGKELGGDTGEMIGRGVGMIGGGLGGYKAAGSALNKVDGVAQGVAKGFSEGVPSRVVKSADDVASEADTAYQAADKLGGVLSPKVTNKFLAEARMSAAPLTEKGKFLAGDTPAMKLMEKLDTFQDKPITLKEAQEIDEFLGDVVDGLLHPNGKLTKQGKKVYDLQSQLRRSINEASPMDVVGGKDGFEALKKGRQLWSQSAQLRDIEKVLTRAEMSDNPATTIRTGFRTLASNPARMKGFSTETQKLIKKAADTGVVGELLRIGASRLIPVGAGAMGNIGGAIGGAAVGMASRGAGASMQAGRAANVARSILNEGRGVPSTAQRVGAGAKALVGKITGQRGDMSGVDAQKALAFGAGGAAAGAVVADKIVGPTEPQTYANGDMPTGNPKPRPTLSVPNKVEAPKSEDVSKSFIDKMVKVESGGRADAKNPNSTATGLAQFTEGTWLATIKKFKPSLLREYGERGVLELRKDAKIALEMARNLTGENKKALDRAELPTNDTTLYLAHFLGAEGAKRLLKAPVGTPVEMVLSKQQINANKSVLAGKKAEDVLYWAQRKMADSKPRDNSSDKTRAKRKRVTYADARKAKSDV